MTINIKLRDATIDDLSLLRYWDTQAHVIAADPDDDWNWESELKRNPLWREQLIAELDGRPIGMVQIIDPKLEDSHYWGEIEDGFRAIDIWLGELSDLGKGYGSIIMQMVINRCFAENEVQAILVDPLASNKKAHRFYEKLGFTLLEKRRFGNEDCAVYKLDRADA